MKRKPKRAQTFLLATARAVAAELKQRGSGTPMRVRLPGRCAITNTDGWCATVGNLGKNRPSMEIWLDRFPGYDDRKLYAGFWSTDRPRLVAITQRVTRSLWRHRVITDKDWTKKGYVVLRARLRRSEFNQLVLEKYGARSTFFGFYDPTRGSAHRVSPHFCALAAAFFESVARALPHATPEDEEREVYAQEGNRKRVASHLRRERSRFLATERKIRDDYKCQVCGTRFEEVYGRLGKEFAEAHHIIPLSQLRGEVTTSIDDLRTVCANCHRMLHRMTGRRSDVRQLRALVGKHRSG